MTVAELARTPPNGFHDAEVTRIELDYAPCVARLHMDVWTGDLSSGDESVREAYRLAILTLTGLQYFVIPPPGADGINAMPPSVDLAHDDHPPENCKPLDEDAFQSIFYVSDWDASIQFAAAAASLVWSDAGGDDRAGDERSPQ